MNEQLTTIIRQARLHLQRGNSEQAVALLEKARILAKGDAGILQQILPDLINAYYAIGRASEAAEWEEQLAWLQGKQTGSSLHTSTGYSQSSMEGYSYSKKASWQKRILLCLLAIAVTGGIAGLGYWGHRWATNRYSPTAISNATNTGYGLLMGRYAGNVNGVNVSVSYPLRSGTCLGVDSEGTFLVPGDLAAPLNYTLPGQLPEPFRTLSLLNTELWITCGQDNSFSRATVKKPLKSSHFVLVQIDRRVEHPIRFSNRELNQSEEYTAIGFPYIELFRSSDNLRQLNYMLQEKPIVKSEDWFERISGQSVQRTPITIEAVQGTTGGIESHRLHGQLYPWQGVVNQYGALCGVVSPLPVDVATFDMIPVEPIKAELDTVLLN